MKTVQIILVYQIIAFCVMTLIHMLVVLVFTSRSHLNSDYAKNFLSTFQIVRIFGSKLKLTSQTNHSFVLLFIGTPTIIYNHFKISYVIDTLLSLENEKISYIVCGDINVNFFDKKSKIIREYTNSLNYVGCLSLIDIPTRFSDTGACKPSILDHIYTNINKLRTKGGVCITIFRTIFQSFLFWKGVNSHLKQTKN